MEEIIPNTIKQKSTIKLSETTKKELDKLKIIERESYEGVIKRLVNLKDGERTTFK